MKDLTQRKPNRLKSYDYSQNGAYFLTICTKNREEILSQIENGNILLSRYGEIVKQEIENISSIRKECVIEKYVIMPNHIHIIVHIVGDDGNRPKNSNRPENSNRLSGVGKLPQQSGILPQQSGILPQQSGGLPSTPTVSNMVQGLKGAVSRHLGFSLWQRSFYDHIIRNENDYLRIAEYIENNPRNWLNDCFHKNKEV
jgi:REP element-mobilizing transposase RayT